MMLRNLFVIKVWSQDINLGLCNLSVVMFYRFIGCFINKIKKIKNVYFMKVWKIVFCIIDIFFEKLF